MHFDCPLLSLEVIVIRVFLFVFLIWVSYFCDAQRVSDSSREKPLVKVSAWIGFVQPQGCCATVLFRQ
jgi:hypothetical protein